MSSGQSSKRFVIGQIKISQNGNLKLGSFSDDNFKNPIKSTEDTIPILIG
jgi:hypothetical protein